MKSDSYSDQNRPREPEFLFTWRDRSTSSWNLIGGVVIALVLFVLLLSTIRVRLATPARWIEHKAAVIQLTGEVDGRAWTLRALEGGPFPTRFDPTTWPASRQAEAAAIRSATLQRQPHDPQLLNFPAPPPLRLPTLAEKGERFFPKPTPQDRPEPAAKPWKTLPFIQPLAALPEGSLPESMPAFTGSIDAETAAESWRFLIRLRPDGGVAECLPLTGAGLPGGDSLVAWLRSIKFSPALHATHPWLALAIGFTNQAADGPDPR
jgi:hypothetical protein